VAVVVAVRERERERKKLRHASDVIDTSRNVAVLTTRKTSPGARQHLDDMEQTRGKGAASASLTGGRAEWAGSANVRSTPRTAFEAPPPPADIEVRPRPVPPRGGKLWTAAAAARVGSIDARTTSCPMANRRSSVGRQCAPLASPPISKILLPSVCRLSRFRHSHRLR